MSIINIGTLNKIFSRIAGDHRAISFPHGKNLFNKDTITLNCYLNGVNGVVNDPNFYVSDYIPVIESSKIKVSSITSNPLVFVCFYKDKNFISSQSTQSIANASSIITIPTNVNQIRISNGITQTPEALQIEYGIASTLYESYSAVPTLPKFSTDIKVSVKPPEFGGFTPMVLPYGKNMFNNETSVVDKYINSSGNEVVGVGFYCSAPIKVIPNAKITLSKASSSAAAGTAFYNDFGFVSFISDQNITTNNNTITIPSNANFMRVSGVESTNPKSLFQIEYGTKTTEYEVYSNIPTQLNNCKPQEVFIKGMPLGFIENGKYVYGKVTLDSTVGKIKAIYNNHVVWSSNDELVYYTNLGIDSNYGIKNSAATLTVNVSALPNVTVGSLLSRAAIFNSKNGMRTLLFTNKNQVYYSDGQEFGNFKLSKIWTLPGDEFKHPSVTLEEKDPSGTRYRYYMPSNISSRGEQFGWFNSLLWLKSESLSASPVESLIFANYHTGTNSTAVPSCVFQTDDGENIYIQYMFGIPCGYVRKAGTTDYISNGSTGYGDDLDTSLFANSYISGLTIKKRVNIIPSLTQSDPTDKFEIVTPVNITNFTKAKPAVATVSSATGIVAGNVVFIDGDALDAEWNTLRNTTASVTSGGNGRFYTVKSVSGNALTLAETIGNPNNNLVPRHIHSLNFFANGVAIGTGEIYPQSYLVFNRIHRDTTSTEWRKNTLLTTSEKSLQRTIGVHLRRDNKILFSSDEMWQEQEIDALKVRGVALKSTTAGVWKGSIADVDDASKFNNVLWGIDPCFKFCELTKGVLLCVTNSGATYISFDEGDTWDYIVTDGNWKNHTIGFDKGGRRFFFDKNVFIDIK